MFLRHTEHMKYVVSELVLVLQIRPIRALLFLDYVIFIMKRYINPFYSRFHASIVISTCYKENLTFLQNIYHL